MLKTIFKYLCVPALLLISASEVYMHATDFGVFNSPKGFGIEFRFNDSGREFNMLSAYADTYGIFEGRCLYPGFKLNYSRCHTVSSFSINNTDMDFYVGPGVTLGYARQYEPYTYKDHRKYLTRNYGAVACLAGTFGFKAKLSNTFSIDLNWTVEAGVHMRPDENRQGLKLGLYKTGLLESLYPQLIISVAF